MKRAVTAAFYENEFKTQTGFQPGDPEPTSYEQAAGFFSALDLAERTKAITPCASKFIRRQAAKFIRDEFHARLTPEQLVRMVEMGENAQNVMEDATFEIALENLLAQAGLTEDEIATVLSEPTGPTEVPQVEVPQTKNEVN